MVAARHLGASLNENSNLAGSRGLVLQPPRRRVSSPVTEGCGGCTGKCPSGTDLSFTVLFQEKDLISKELGVQAAGVRSFHL